MHVNFSPGMIPGIAVLLTGACLTFFASRFTKDEEKVPKIKMAGVLFCAIGAILTICL
ncbi:MAG: hypothetical protein IJT77_04205 [Clostridia bacterium]|nr:hypothetical protein [Clostridia bacterium]